MKTIAYYFRYLTGVLVAILVTASCERKTPEDYQAETLSGTTAAVGNLVVLDSLIFTNPVKTNTLVRFDLLGTPPSIKTGDIVYYPAGEGVFGQVISATITGSRMLFNLGTCSLNQVFTCISFQDSIRVLALKSRNRTDHGIWKSDTLQLNDFELYNDFWDTKKLVVKFTSGKLYSKPMVGQMAMAAEGKDPWFDRFRLDCSYSMEVEGNLFVQTAKATDATDSLLIEQSVYGPFLINGFPITYLVDTWLGFHVVTAGDTVVTFNLSGLTSGSMSLNFNYWEDWTLNRTNQTQNATVATINGPKLSDYLGNVFVNQIVTPVFCGDPALSLTNRFSASVTYNLLVPNWDANQTASMAGQMQRMGKALYNFVPEKLSTTETALYHEAQEGVLVNQPPKAAFTINPGAGYTDTNFVFDASTSTDLESPASLLQVRWDFNGDNHFDTEYSTEKIAYKKFPIPGTYEAILEVMDPQGLTSRSTKEITVSLSSSAPVAYFTVTPESGRINDAFIFDASGSYDTEDGVTQLKVHWDFDGDGIWDQGWTTNKAAVFVYSEPGKYIARLEVLDTQGLIGSTTRIVNVAAANIKPTGVFTVNPESGTIETTFSFDASGCSDPEDPVESLQIRWDWNNDGVYDTDYRTIKTIQHVFPVAGTYTVVMEVIDTEGYGSTFAKTIVVSNPNTPPEADFNITPETGDLNTEITFDASISTDLEDSLSQLEVRWDWDNDNRYDTNYSTEKVIKRTFTVTGTYIIKVQVKDSGGLTDTKAKLLIIK